MFEDHWYHPSSQPEFSSLHRQESVKRQSPERNSRKVAEERKTPPGPPEADVPRRPKSCTDLRALGQQVDTLLIPGAGREVVNGIAEELPSRPKSRNDLDDLKTERYERGKWLKARGRGGRAAKKPKELKDELDFADWYGEFEDGLRDANSEHKLFQYTLDSYLTTCNSLISTTDSTLGLLAELEKSFQTVHSQTSSFQETCSSLLTHQSHITSLLGSISTNLHPFTELDPITRALSRPGSDFVKTPSFREMLTRLFAVGHGFLAYDGDGGGSEDMSPGTSRTGSLYM